jgi:hypothetical protein
MAIVGAVVASVAIATSVSGLSGESPVFASQINDGGNFVDIASKVGVHFQHVASHTSQKYPLEIMGSGVALFDYDNDGRLDIFFVNGAHVPDPGKKGAIPQKDDPKFWNRLYHQKEDGTFEDVTERAGLRGAGYGMGVAVGDYDNDGYEDLFVTGYGGNHLYHNNHDGTFTDVTQEAGVQGDGWSSSSAWVDLDNDGLLDLVVARYLTWDFDDFPCYQGKDTLTYCDPSVFSRSTPLVYHNDGKGHFTEVADKIGISKPGNGLGVAIGDYDRDGHIDVYIANDHTPGLLYRNKANGTFEEVGLLSGVGVNDNGHTYAGMGVDFADYDNDGLPDLIVDDLALQAYALYRNNGNGTFTNADSTSGLGFLTMPHSGWGLRLVDYDNDGWKDLLVSQGHVIPTIEQTNSMIHYQESMMLARNVNGKFIDVSRDSGSAFRTIFAGRGLAVGDIDNDGRLDAVVTSNDGPAFVLHNETTNENHWLTLALVGHKSNRDAIGAEVKIETASGMQFVIVSTSSSYCSSSDKRVHFGLDSDQVVKSMEIRWPSGIVQTMHDIPGDRFLQIDEPIGASASGSVK